MINQQALISYAEFMKALSSFSPKPYNGNETFPTRWCFKVSENIIFTIHVNVSRNNYRYFLKIMKEETDIMTKKHLVYKEHDLVYKEHADPVELCKYLPSMERQHVLFNLDFFI